MIYSAVSPLFAFSALLDPYHYLYPLQASLGMRIQPSLNSIWYSLVSKGYVVVLILSGNKSKVLVKQQGQLGDNPR